MAGGCARMPNDPALALLGDQAMAAKNVTDRRAGRPGPAGVAFTQDRHQLLSAPRWMPAPGFDDRRHHMVGCVARRGVGPAGALFKALRAVDEGAVDPFVSGLTADAVERAELGH